MQVKKQADRIRERHKVKGTGSGTQADRTRERPAGKV
jgi:hypothetical protein